MTRVFDCSCSKCYAGLSPRGPRQHHGITTQLWSMGAACLCLVRQRQITVVRAWNDKSAGIVLKKKKRYF